MPITDARYFKSILICPDKAMAAELMPMLAYGLPLAPIHDITTYPTRRQLVDLAKSVEPKLFFLDFTTSLDQAAAALTDINSVMPGMIVIALLGGNDPDLILKCLRQGASDFLIRPFTADQIDCAVEKLTRSVPGALARPTVGGKVIAVMPVRGGCGATTIACNLAHQCKRLAVKKTLLCDFDALTGTISFVLKLKSGHSFVDVLHRQGTLDKDLWKQMIVQQPHGLDALLAPENAIEYANELPSAVPILEFAQSHYDVLVVDCGSSFGTWNLSIANACDELLLVTTNELAALQSTQKVLAYLDNHRVDTAKVKLIVNRYNRDAGLNSDHIAKAVGCEVYLTIPSEHELVQKSLMEGKPIPAGSSVGKGLSSLAGKVIGVRENNTEPRKTASRSIFSAIFSR